MKAIGTPIKLGMAILVAIILVMIGLNFVHGFADIDFERLLQWRPQTGTPTEPGWGEGVTSYSVEDIKAERIFTKEPNAYDLSEIACHIATDIYNDYKKFGDNGIRTGRCVYGLPFSTYMHDLEPGNDVYKYGTGCLVSAKSFLYKQQTLPFDSYEVEFAKNGYPDCHLCRNKTATPPLEIKNLDQTCINMNLKDRVVDNTDFCKGGFYSESGSAQFGNCVDNQGGDDSVFGNNYVTSWKDASNGKFVLVGGLQNCENDVDDFCDNDEEKLGWSANTREGTWKYESWRVKDTAFKRNDDILYGDSSSKTPYVYGLFWIPEAQIYDIVFVVVPDKDARITNDFNEIWNKDLKKGEDFYRTNALGNYYLEARTVANFIVTLSTDVNIYQDIMQNIATEAYGSSDKIDKVHFQSCFGLDTCFPKVSAKSKAQCSILSGYQHYYAKDMFLEEDIYMYTNATDVDDNLITNPNENLLAGKKYRVIVRNWWGRYRKCMLAGCPNVANSAGDCYLYAERAVTILEIK